MASSCLSNDKRNFQCIAVASVDLIKLPLRDILANHIYPTDLFNKIKSCSTLNLRQDQLKICLAKPPDYNSFDVSLLYTLIRNLCPLPCPAQGWGKEPKATDTLISDDIERLRLFRNNYYAHAESAGISESLFKDIWRNLRSAIKRIQPRCNANYEDELVRIEQSKYTLSHWQECMTLLNAYASNQKRTDGGDAPDIFIQGENEIICGGKARFEADVKNVESSCWSITWQKRRGDVIKCIDTNMHKYNGSTKNRFVINAVSKEDEGEYQAVLSLESNGPEYKSRNIIRLYALGEIPFLNISEVKSGSEEITIHYNCEVLEQSPKVHSIEWRRNGQQLDNNSKKYVGGGVQDRCFTIMSPTNDDRGNYSCKVANAVGSVSTTISLDIPSVEISIDSPVCFGSETTIKSVVSTSMPTPEKIEWQKSKDGVDFNCIRYAKYPQSTNSATCPSFVINKTSFDDKCYYRLLVWNGIGESVSNTVYLKVTGSPPNITTSFETNIKNRSVKLIGNLYFFDDSPGTLENFWTKDDEKIKTKESGEKLSDISNDYSSLTITNVCPDDAGEYRLTAINAVGSSTSDVIVLGVPTVFVKRVEPKKYGGQRITVTIKSLPAPCHIQWSAKTEDEDSFTPIDTNAEKYKGTTVSFPHPVLVVRQKDQLEKKCYQIEVMNFIGKTVLDILGNIKSTERKKDIVENTFYKDRGARVRFTKLSNILARQFPPQKLEILKFTLTNSNIVQNRSSVMEATSALECIRILQDEKLFTQTDVIVMQFLCTQTECLDLYAKCIEYAEQQKALCYFEKPSVNGYKNAQFHVQGDLSNYTKQYIQDVIETVAVILDCKEEDILLNGVRHSTSFLLSLSVKEGYIRELFAMNEQNRLRLKRLDIDYLIIDKETIHLERSKVQQKIKTELRKPPRLSFLPTLERHEYEISKWKEDESVFLETHNFSSMLEQVKKQSFVTIVGVPGSGKTVTARHIALILQTEGYEILPIRDIRNIKTFCNPEKPQVFVIDDVLGVFGLIVGDIDVMGKYKDLLENPSHLKTKVLMTCREVIYRNERSLNSFLFKKEKVILLHSEENALNDKDKFDLFEKYKLDKNMLSSVDLSSVSKMFPYLCKLFSKEKKFIGYGPKFFMCPLSCILRELNEMQLKNKIQYASLVLLMASGNILSEKIINSTDNENSKFNEMKCQFLRRCKVRQNTDSFEIIDALSKMEETYTKKRGNEFSCIHNTMLEITAYHFGRQFPKLMLQYLNADYIAHYIKVETRGINNERAHKDQTYREKSAKQESVVDLNIKLEESYYKNFAERLFRDVENGELHAVFENEALKNSSVLAQFISVMKKKSYSDLYSIFLSQLKENFKISRHELAKACVRDSSHFYIHMLLLNERTTRSNYTNNVRAISWVIYHGHYQILKFIIKNIIKENGHITDLFQNSFNKKCRRHSVSEGDTDKSAVSNDASVLNRKSEFPLRKIRRASDTRSEPVTEEQCRLLCLGCYSGNLNTVQILLKYVQEDAINKEEIHWNIKPLVIACKLGHSDIVKILLNAGANVNLNDASHTPLTAACENGHYVVVKELIKARADVNKKYMHKTPLTSACYMGHLNIVDELLKAEADINLSDENSTPLTAALKEGHLNIVDVLIKAMFNVSFKDEGKIPLTTGCCKNSLSVVKELVNAGVDVNQRDKYETPLNIACYSGKLGIVKELLKAGANVNLNDLSHTPLTASCDKGHLSVVEELIKAGANINVNYRYNTPLRAACYRGHLSVVRVLLKAGAVVNQRERDKTPLTTACYKGHLHIVKELINAGADVNMLVACDKISVISVCKNEHLSKNPHIVKALADITLKRVFKTPLTAASYMGHFGVVQELIKAGADVNLKTPLTAASYMGHLNIVDELLKAGANVNLSDENSTPLTASYNQGHLRIVEVLINAMFNVDLKADGKTALTTACCKNSLSVVKELIKAGTDVNQRDKYKTPLNIACYNGQLDIVKELIKSGANVNLNDLSHTPLTASCDKGHLSVVEELIKAGANINVNYRYNTPLRAACYRGHLSVVRVLLKAGAVVNQRERDKTPLIAACIKGHLRIVKELINAGANVNLKGDKSPLTIALENDHWSIVQELRIAGADDNGDY